MAAFDTTRPTAVNAAGSISQFAANLVGTLTAWNDARVTRKSLSQLSARELDDIGLCAGDIETVSRRTF